MKKTFWWRKIESLVEILYDSAVNTYHDIQIINAGNFCVFFYFFLQKNKLKKKILIENSKRLEWNKIKLLAKQIEWFGSDVMLCNSTSGTYHKPYL